MALEARIQDDLKAALLSGNRFVSDTLRGLKAVILDEKVALGKREDGLTDTEIEKLLAKELKKRRESAAIYQENARDDLAEAEAAEAALSGDLSDKKDFSDVDHALSQAFKDEL